MYENENNDSINGGYYQTSQSAPQVPQFEQPQKGKASKEKSKKSSGFFRKMIACASLGLCFGLCAGVGVYAVGESTGIFDQWEAASQEKVKEVSQTTNIRNGSTESGVINTTNVTSVTSDVSDVVEKVMPSMVSIMNHYVERVSYFGQVMEQEQNASGSGIIVGENDTELLIATNYHVVADAMTLTVHFDDGTEVDAVIKGTDPDMDLAVIAVPLSEMSEETISEIAIANLGDSDSLKLGEPVIAIGNALGYGQSVTGGWVSALNREVDLEDGTKGTFIQTDAAINPGNSGGALLNMNGEVIGINSNKIGGTVIEGIGYAIPISAAQPILEELMTKETKTKVSDEESGYLGIIPQSVTSDVAQIYGMPEGVFVYQIEEETPAAKGGMLRGDIITKLDGTRLSTAEELRETLKYYQAGETVDITVMRNQNGEYEEVVLQIILGSKPSDNS
ncbi:MAG TPA: trypsin-like peptidase domain-containing protein [Lachnospiraceae bacterium]|nr:trypsin-like peptidase domain-containing protein [Lachnospiraceae bacterium]